MIYKRFRLHFILAIFILCLFSGFSQNPENNYKRNGNKVDFVIGEAKLRIHVLDEDIMQVNYTLANTFSTKKSLILEDTKWPEIDFSVDDKEGITVIATKKMQAKVNTQTGQIKFYDADGNLLLQEKPGGGKTIRPIDFEGIKTNELKQEFELSNDEAIYGLGQHQNGLLNIRGYDLNLFQHNTEVYIPFLVSTAGYGLLWHNYSHTKFGNPDAIKVIIKDQLFNDKGEPGGLSAKLYADKEFKKPLDRNGKQIGSTVSVEKDTTENAVESLELSGSLKAKKSGEHLFYSYADGKFKLYINDKLILDNWAPYANARDLGRIDLKKGQKYNIKVVWNKFHKKNSFQLKMKEPQEDRGDITLWSQAGEEINYYVFAGNSLDDVIAGYREATGRAPLLPKYAMGFWQSRERYKSQQELLDVVQEFRNREIPLDIIIQDWQYWKKGEWGSHLFDEKRFPNVENMIDELHEKWNAKFMISVWGKFYPGSKTFNELNDGGFLYQKALQDTLRDFTGSRYTYYDAFNPAARKLYWEQINQNLYSKGVDGWWLDATEPELPDYGPTPKSMAHYMDPTYEGSGVENLNAFPLMTSKAIYEGQRSSNPNKRVNILTRSAFAGQQRYATTIWSGDISGEWGALKASIPAGLSLALSGIPYWTTDIGGFWVRYAGGNQNEEYRELFTRWYQFGAFCPIFRAHGSNTEREMWYFGDKDSEIYKTQLKFNKLRYRLMPYLYSLAGMVTHKDYTMMRALVMDFQDDKKVWDIKDQYMFGPSIMVNPVKEYQANTRKVYLPQSKGWYDFWTGEFYEAGKTINAPAPLESMPLYVKAGSIIPLGPELQYATEKPADPIELRVFTGDDGEFTLYEDENNNNNYENGAFNTIRFKWNEDAQTLTIEERKGNFPGMLKERTINVVFVDKQNDQSLFKTFETVVYQGNKITIQKTKK